MRASLYFSVIVAVTIVSTIASIPDAAAAHRRHHHHGYNGIEYGERGGFGRRDPDNIGPYGGRDFGFYGGPNGETTYDYR